MENQDSIDARFTLHSTTADQAKKSWQTMTRMRRETAPDGTVVFHVLFAGDDFEKKITRMTGPGPSPGGGGAGRSGLSEGTGRKLCKVHVRQK